MTKKLFFHSAIGIALAGVCGATLAHAESFDAQIQLVGVSGLTLKTPGFLGTGFDASSVTFGNEAVELSVPQPGEVVSSDVQVKNGAGDAVDLKIPSSDYIAGQTLAISASADDTGQGIGFRGQIDRTEVMTWKQLTSRPCIAQRYEYNCQDENSGICGNSFVPHRDFKDVLVVYQRVQDEFSGDFISSSGQPLAHLISQPKLHDIELSESDESICGGQAPQELRESLGNPPPPIALPTQGAVTGSRILGPVQK